MIGNKFNKLTVVEQLVARKNRYVMYNCECECGNQVHASGSDLKGSRVKSCGCILGKHLLKANARRRHPLYHTYRGMLQRCTNPSAISYRWYGAKGVKVCQRWVDSFENFAEDMGERPPATTLDRIDVNGNYCKENCRWATKMEQAMNRRKIGG